MIRAARQSDCRAMCEIYAPYVQDTAITFDEVLPTPQTFLHKLEVLCPKYPFFVWEQDGEIAAYAYASAFRERAAYRFSAELSVYAAPAFIGRGIGKSLYGALLDALVAQGYQTAYGLVTVPNDRSVGLHQALGFTQAGLLKRTGYKLNRWHDVAIFEKALGQTGMP